MKTLLFIMAFVGLGLFIASVFAITYLLFNLMDIGTDMISDIFTFGFKDVEGNGKDE